MSGKSVLLHDAAQTFLNQRGEGPSLFGGFRLARLTSSSGSRTVVRPVITIKMATLYLDLRARPPSDQTVMFDAAMLLEGENCALQVVT